MPSIDDQLKQLDSELEALQKGFTYKVDSDSELKNFILETKAHQFAMTQLVWSMLAKMNDSTLHSEKQRYTVFLKGRLIELLKKWATKYGHSSGGNTSSSN